MKLLKIIDLRKKKPGNSRVVSARTRGEGRVSPRRQRRKKVKIYVTALGVAVFILVASLASESTYHQKISIGPISVSGVSRISPRLVKAVFEKTLHDGMNHFFSRSNVLWYPKHELEKAILSGIPRTASVSITREGLFAQAITVTIEERKRFGFWCSDSSLQKGQRCFEMDENGFIFAALASETPLYGIIFSGPLSASTTLIGQTFIGEHMSGVVAFLKKLENKNLKPIRVSTTDMVYYWVELPETVLVRVAFGADPEETARNLELALSSDALRGRVEELEYIDLRFGNRLYYKVKR